MGELPGLYVGEIAGFTWKNEPIQLKLVRPLRRLLFGKRLELRILVLDLISGLDSFQKAYFHFVGTGIATPLNNPFLYLSDSDEGCGPCA